MEILADRIAGAFIRNGVAAEDDRDIYVYGLIQTFSNGIGLIVAIAVGFAFAIPLEMLIFFIMLTALRMSAGGYHAGTFLRCAVVSSLAIVAAAAIISVSTATIYAPAIAIILPVSLIITFIFAPIEDKNRTLTSEETIKFRKRSRRLAVGGALILGSATALGGDFAYYSFCATLGLGVATISIFAAFLKQKYGGEANEEE